MVWVSSPAMVNERGSSLGEVKNQVLAQNVGIASLHLLGFGKSKL